MHYLEGHPADGKRVVAKLQQELMCGLGMTVRSNAFREPALMARSLPTMTFNLSACFNGANSSRLWLRCVLTCLPIV